MGSLLQNLLGGKKESVLGVDIGSSSIKVVQIDEHKGKKILKTYGEIALGPKADLAIGQLVKNKIDITVEALVEVIKESNTDTKNATIAFASSGTLVFTISLPESALTSLETVVPNEARRYIPTSLSEVTLNWVVIPQHISRADQMGMESDEPLTQRDILVIAVRNEMLADYQTITSQAALSVENYESEIFSGIRSVYDTELSPTALVDCGASGFRVIIMHHGIVRTVHTINRGGAYITQQLAQGLELSFEDAEKLKRDKGLVGDDERVRDRLNYLIGPVIDEVKNVIVQYEKTNHKPLDSIVLIGGGARMKGLLDKIHSETQITTRVGDPFTKVDNPAFLDGVLSQIGPEFAVALGIALSHFE